MTAAWKVMVVLMPSTRSRKRRKPGTGRYGVWQLHRMDAEMRAHTLRWLRSQRRAYVRIAVAA